MKLSVIIPVYNEQETINDTIEHLKSLGDCEIIVSDSNDQTNNNIKYKDVVKVSSSRGRSIQMNTGAFFARNDLFLFLHADTKLPENYQEEIKKSLENHDVGAFKLKIGDKKVIFRIIEKAVYIRNKLTRIPYGDQAIFCTREAFEKVGGYKDIPIMEDVRFMQDCKKHKLRLCLSDLPVLTSARRWKKEGFLYTTLRNWTIISLYHLGVSPNRLKKYYK